MASEDFTLDFTGVSKWEPQNRLKRDLLPFNGPTTAVIRQVLTGQSSNDNGKYIFGIETMDPDMAGSLTKDQAVTGTMNNAAHTPNIWSLVPTLMSLGFTKQQATAELEGQKFSAAAFAGKLTGQTVYVDAHENFFNGRWSHTFEWITKEEYEQRKKAGGTQFRRATSEGALKGVAPAGASNGKGTEQVPAAPGTNGAAQQPAAQPAMQPSGAAPSFFQSPAAQSAAQPVAQAAGPAPTGTAAAINMLLGGTR